MKTEIYFIVDCFINNLFLSIRKTEGAKQRREEY